MAKAISYKISLLGSEQVVNQFRAVGAAGQEAFEKIQKAAAAAASVAGFSQAGQAAQSAATGMAAAGKSAEQAAAGFAIGRRELVGLSKALNEVGLGSFTRGFTPLIGVGARLGPLAVGITAIGAALAAAGTAFFGFTKGAAETASTLDALAKAGNVSFEFLSSLQIAFNEGGTSLKTFAQEVSNLQEKIAAARDGGVALAESADRTREAFLSSKSAILGVKDAALSLREARSRLRLATGQSTEAEQKEEQQVFDLQRKRQAVEQAQLRLQEAQLRRRAALRAQEQAQANDLNQLVGTFENLSKGIQTAFDPLTTLESKIKAIATLLSKVRPEDQFGKLGDIFKTLGLVDRAQIGRALGLSPETIETLSKGSEALRAAQAQARQLGIALDSLDKSDLSSFKSAISEIGAILDALKDKMGALAAPAFTSFFQGLGERIKELIPQFLNLASTFGQIDFKALGRAFGDLLLKLADIAVQIGKVFEAAAKGDTSGLEAALQRLGQLVSEQLSALGRTAGEAFAAGIVAGMTTVKIPPASEMFPAIVEEFRKFGESIVKNWEILKQKLSGGLISPAGAAEAGGGGQMDFGPMIAAAEVAAARIKQIFTDALATLGQSLTIDFSGVQMAAQTAATQMSAEFSQIDIASTLTGQINGLINKFNELAQAAVAAANAAASAAAAGAGSSAGGGGGNVPPFARGGLLGGRGTGTSDSNLAWVSRGEHIMPARAVRQPGVLSFLEALRRSGGNLRGVLDDMGRFARGGLMLPAFANGGPVGSMSHVTINFPGTPPISGLRASAAVVDELRNAAALAQVRSGGRKPSRYS